MKVSTLILTYNEATNLPACLHALHWCDDMVVVDSGSSDETVEIAHRFGARVLAHPFENFARQRNFGLENGAFRHEWILHLDADEIVSDAFASALHAFPENASIDAYRVPLQTILFGKWLRYAGMWPAYQVRLGHTTRLRFVQVGHGQREDLSPERVGTFGEPLLHYSFSLGCKRWLEKHVRYAHDEAREIARLTPWGDIVRGLFSRDKTLKRRAAKSFAAKLPLAIRPLARFIYVYFLRFGFLDGLPGFWYAFMLSTYEAMTAILALERVHPMSNRIPEAQGPEELESPREFSAAIDRRVTHPARWQPSPWTRA